MDLQKICRDSFIILATVTLFTGCGGGGESSTTAAVAQSVTTDEGTAAVLAPAASDTDNDGVPNDGTDECPTLGDLGYGLNAYGCPYLHPVSDSDGDGVIDDVDECPTKGDIGFGLDASGCPTDSDNDGVPDGDDLCQYRYGTTSVGCIDTSLQEPKFVKDNEALPAEDCRSCHAHGPKFLDHQLQPVLSSIPDAHHKLVGTLITRPTPLAGDGTGILTCTNCHDFTDGPGLEKNCLACHDLSTVANNQYEGNRHHTTRLITQCGVCHNRMPEGGHYRL